MVKLMKSDAALHILTVGMLTTKRLCAEMCPSLFLSQSAFVTCCERGKGGVKRRKYSVENIAMSLSLPLSLCPCSN